MSHGTLDKAVVDSVMAKVKKKYIVMSGKGGVGKSSVAVNLAVGLALQGKKVGLIDADLHGPSVAKMLGLQNAMASGTETAIKPIELLDGNLKVISVQFMLEKEDDAVIWRGALKHSIINQFVGSVVWGDLDYLFIDSPPGTGDEPLSIVQTITDLDGAVVVTTPQEVSVFDVKKSISFCKKMNLKVFGIVENMAGFACPSCGEITSIFGEGGGESVAENADAPLLGSIPLDPVMVVSGDSGKAFIQEHKDSVATVAINEIVKKFL